MSKPDKDQYRKRAIRMRVNESEYEMFKGIQKAVDSHELKLSDVKHGWLKNKNSSVFFKNPEYNKGKSYEEIRDELWQDAAKFAPKYPKIKRKPIKEGHLLVLDPSDIHVGKLSRAYESGDEYTIQIATQRVRDGVNGIINKAQGFNIDKILFIGGNDVLHIDNAKRTTTSGTPQDTDGMWYESFLEAKKMYVEVLETLLSVADVHFVFNPSNHDYTNGFFLCDSIYSWFRNCKNITFDVSIAHRKYFTYGLNLIGTTHGDGAKQNDLPLLMAHEAEEWSNAKHRYIYTHHLHHKVSKDVLSVCIETLRSPSGTDSWHHRNGYQHAPKAIEGFLHHPIYGQISRITHIF